MSWNHRIVKRTWKNEDREDDHRYGIHEAYCDEHGKVFMITENAIAPYGDNMEELKQSFEWMQQAFNAPILDYDNIPEDGAIDPCPPQNDK